MREDRQPGVVPLDCVCAAGRRGSRTGLFCPRHTKTLAAGGGPDTGRAVPLKTIGSALNRALGKTREAARGCRCCVLGAFSLPRSLGRREREQCHCVCRGFSNLCVASGSLRVSVAAVPVPHL